jgi:hypothetical protein
LRWQTEIIDDVKVGGICLEPAAKRVSDALPRFGHARAQATDTGFFGDLHYPSFAVSLVYRGVGLAHINQSLPMHGARTSVRKLVAPTSRDYSVGDADPRQQAYCRRQ